MLGIHVFLDAAHLDMPFMVERSSGQSMTWETQILIFLWQVLPGTGQSVTVFWEPQEAPWPGTSPRCRRGGRTGGPAAGSSNPVLSTLESWLPPTLLLLLRWEGCAVGGQHWLTDKVNLLTATLSSGWTTVWRTLRGQDDEQQNMESCDGFEIQGKKNGLILWLKEKQNKIKWKKKTAHLSCSSRQCPRI